MDPDFQIFRRIAFPFHLPPSDFLIGQLPRAWPFICWLFPLTELSMDALSLGFQFRHGFIWLRDLFCPVLWCMCVLNFSLYLAPFCRFCLFVHNYFFVAIPVSLTQPRWLFSGHSSISISLGPAIGALLYSSDCAIVPWFFVFLEDSIAFFFWTQSFLPVLLASE